MHSHDDVIIRGGTLFDGTGTDGIVADLGIKDGVVTRIRTRPIVAGPSTRIIDAAGKWVMPGFIDLHTHYDAEVEVLPHLSESVRHGVTTVVLGSCSLSLAVGTPVNLADMFCRVEAIPRSVVLPMLQQKKDWDGPASYFKHLESLPLGPNVASFLGHSTVRMEAMGIARALDKRVKPTHDEMKRMEALLEEALDAGYLGLSIMTLPWDKMDGEEFRSRPLPSVFARWSEYRRLNTILRRRNRVFQGVPNISTKVNLFLFLLETIGLLRPALRTTIISMMDIRADRFAFRIAGLLSRITNTLLDGNFRLQALPEVFDLWADGIDLVVFEEFGAGAAALHLEDHARRAELLNDPAYRARFKRQWRNKFLPRAFHRNLTHSEILACPEAALVGKSFAQVAQDAGRDVVDVFLDLVVKHGRALRWYTVMGNDRPEWLRWIMKHPDILVGFSDAGAHLRNMAHYNFPLRMLRMAREAEKQGIPFMGIAKAVHRLTAEPSQWLGLDAGVLKVGRRADVVVVDPDGLTPEVDEAREEEMEGFGLKRMVRRNDAAVRAVLINGRTAFLDGKQSEGFGRERTFGRVLRAAD